MRDRKSLIQGRSGGDGEEEARWQTLKREQTGANYGLEAEVTGKKNNNLKMIPTYCPRGHLIIQLRNTRGREGKFREQKISFDHVDFEVPGRGAGDCLDLCFSYKSASLDLDTSLHAI